MTRDWLTPMVRINADDRLGQLTSRRRVSGWHVRAV